jgi:DNA-binding LacI/PurR family transcriptional regulator
LETHGAPDAYVAFIDTLAVGTARAVLDAGLEIPRDVKVWGFGDFPEAENYRVPLTSVRIPIEAVSNQGWDWLMARIENPGREHRLKVIPMELIERDSTRF